MLGGSPRSLCVCACVCVHCFLPVVLHVPRGMKALTLSSPRWLQAVYRVTSEIQFDKRARCLNVKTSEVLEGEDKCSSVEDTGCIVHNRLWWRRRTKHTPTTDILLVCILEANNCHLLLVCECLSHKSNVVRKNSSSSSCCSSSSQKRAEGQNHKKTILRRKVTLLTHKFILNVISTPFHARSMTHRHTHRRVAEVVAVQGSPVQG